MAQQFFEGQLKTLYRVDFTFSNLTGKSFTTTIEEVTLGESKANVVKKFNNRLGQELLLQGRVSYGDIMLKGHFDIQASPSDSAVVLSNLWNTWTTDANSVDVVVTMVDLATKQPTFIFEADGCKVSSIKEENVARKDESDLLHFEVTLVPFKVKKPAGPMSVQ